MTGIVSKDGCQIRGDSEIEQLREKDEASFFKIFQEQVKLFNSAKLAEPKEDSKEVPKLSGQKRTRTKANLDEPAQLKTT